MKPISVHVSTRAYDEFRTLATRTGRPIAELIREATSDYLHEQPHDGHSVLDLTPHSSGRALGGWKRAELLDEMRA